MGFNEYAGKLFIPSQANVDSAIRTAHGFKRRATTELQKKLLDSMEAYLRFEEPQPILDEIVSSIFALLVKEGVKDDHMLLLLKNASSAIKASEQRFAGRKIPVGVKALVLYRLGATSEILDAVKAETKSREVKEACDRVKGDVARYVKFFELEGFGHGEFPNVEKVFRSNGFDLGRSQMFNSFLKSALDYHESPEELEKNAISWIDEELPKYQRITQKLAKRYGCEPVAEEVEQKINTRMKLDPKKLVKTTIRIRKVVERFVNEDVHGINPKYRTKVIETPRYLTGILPTGGAQFFDTFTKKPFQIFFQTTDPRRDPDKSVSSVLDLLIHEEYGHCVHHSNSVMGYVGKVPLLQMIPGLPTGTPITEGLSFNRELEFFEASKKLEAKKRLTRAEREYVNAMEEFGGLKLINMELEFAVRRWRIMRFLRVVGDVRVNSGKQGLLEFVDWAHEYVGVPRSSMYFQLFPAHEGAFPGYATSYAVVGQEIREIERKIKDDEKRRKFSTYLCSIGFPPRSLYLKMLREYARNL